MKIKKKKYSGCALVALLGASMSHGALIVDFTTAGNNGGNELNATSFTYSSQDPSGTGVSFDVIATIVVAAGGQQNTGGELASFNAGLGSEVENTGAFLNNINGIPEIIRLTVSNVSGLAVGESIVLSDILSQNGSSTTANQNGGYGGTFGQQPADSVTFTSDLGPAVVVNQSDAGNLGSILLNANSGNATNTGNTFAHSVGDLAFTNYVDLRLTDLSANEAIVLQGLEFSVVPVPEPSSLALAGLGLLVSLKRRR